MSAERRALVAELFEVVEALTPYGGRSATYEPLGSVWLKPGPVRQRERADAGTSVMTEAVIAEARADPRLTAGRLLRFGGGDWRIALGETVRGRARLNLERTR